ncbi:MAG: adenosylmethionine decarboxylase [Rubrivivax sp.]
MDGLHLTAELHECAAKALLAEPAALRALCLAAVAEAGLTPVGELFHHFTAAGGGITGVVLLAESHLAVHTWPELGAVTLDVYVCNLSADNSGRAERVVAALEAAFAPGRRQVQRLHTAAHRPVPPAGTPAAGCRGGAAFSAVDLKQLRRRRLQS